MQERKVELTSAAWLFEPERLFWIAGQINKRRPPEAQVAVELYPTVHNPFWRINKAGSRISLDRIKKWREEHGPVPIERIHLPFHYSLPTAFYNYFYHSIFREPGTWNDRKIASAVAWMTWVSTNHFATNLAGELGAGLNAHVNIIEEAVKRGEVKVVRGDAKYVYVENDVDYPRKRADDLRRGLDLKRAAAAVEENGLEGIILGVDHYYRGKINPRNDILEHEDILKKHLRVVHLSGSGGEHGLIWPHDYNFWSLIDYIRGMSFDNPVSFCLDLNPMEMAMLSPCSQFNYIKDLVEKLER